MKNKLLKYILFLFCSIGILFMVSCQTSRNQTHRCTRYQKVKIRHTPNWNYTTSQRTTYYIKKNAARKSHDSKRIKR